MGELKSRALDPASGNPDGIIWTLKGLNNPGSYSVPRTCSTWCLQLSLEDPHIWHLTYFIPHYYLGFRFPEPEPYGGFYGTPFRDFSAGTRPGPNALWNSVSEPWWCWRDHHAISLGTFMLPKLVTFGNIAKFWGHIQMAFDPRDDRGRSLWMLTMSKH